MDFKQKNIGNICLRFFLKKKAYQAHTHSTFKHFSFILLSLCSLMIGIFCGISETGTVPKIVKIPPPPLSPLLAKILDTPLIVQQ